LTDRFDKILGLYVKPVNGAGMKSILVSAGHNDKDPGACANGYQEATLATKMRDRVASYLKGQGLVCTTDGKPGENQDLAKAIDLCKVHDIAVEIHFNAATPQAHGVEALCKPSEKALAQAICVAINKTTGLTLRGDQGYKPDDSGHHPRLGFCEANGIILEVCFITSATDMATYVKNKEAVALSVANVIAAYARK
jgi:N-acetylmuramoyl-L-alanine amidase